jgi:hypothetical protein
VTVERKNLKPDGKIHPVGDAIEANPDFQDEYDEMAMDFFKESNPGYYELLKRLQKENGHDEGEAL